MANTYRPSGLRPVGTINSSCYTGKLEKFAVLATDAAAIGLGDPVKLTGEADTDGNPVVARITAGDVAVGVMVGVVPVPADLTLNYRKASTAMSILVDTDPNTVYEAVEGDSGTALTAAATGLNASLAMGTVDTTTGNGKTIVNNATEATTATLDVQLLRKKPEVGNEFGYGCKWLVRLNLNQYKASTTGI